MSRVRLVWYRRLLLELIALDPHCHYCRREVRLFRPEDRFVRYVPELAVLDHKTPRSRGGLNRASNLVLCCFACNGRKGRRPYLDFLFEGWLREREPA